MSLHPKHIIVPGAPKSGTSSFHKMLGQHPDIEMSSVKEPHYFSVDAQYERGESYYQSLFSQDAKWKGECSTTYMICPEAIQRMQADLTEVRFIFLLRNPVDRIVSHYNWLSSKNMVQRNFRDEVESEERRSFDANKPERGNYRSYLEFSRYGTWVQRYADVFGISNIQVIFSEDLASNPASVLNSCYKFLGIEPFELIEDIRENQTAERISDRTPSALKGLKKIIPERTKNKIDEVFKIRRWLHKKEKQQTIGIKDRSWLQSILRVEIDLLKEILGREIRCWPEFRKQLH